MSQLILTLSRTNEAEGKTEVIGTSKFKVRWARAEEEIEDLEKVQGDTLDEKIVKLLAIEMMRDLPRIVSKILVSYLFKNSGQEERQLIRNRVILELLPFTDDVARSRMGLY